MNFEELLRDIPYRLLQKGTRRVQELSLTDVITTPEVGGENALFVCVDTPLRNSAHAMLAAYAMGCRLFLCRAGNLPGPEATVLACDDPAAWVGTLASRVHGHPERHLTIFGITGSVGKTSAALLLARVLEHTGARVATVTTDGFSICSHRVPATPIVPDVACMYRMMADMVANGVEFAVLEFSAYQLSQGVARGIPFMAVALSGLEERHTERAEFADFAAYCAAKAALYKETAAFSILPAKGDPRAHECGADTAARERDGFDTWIKSGRVLTYGQGGDLFATQVRAVRGANGVPALSLVLCEGKESVPVLLDVPTADVLPAVLVCALLARVAGVSLADIGEALSHAQIPGRMECVACHEERLVYVDAAYTARDLAWALRTLDGLTRGRLCVLLGSVGGRAGERRAPLGEVASTLADLVYITADDPDSEDVRNICREILAGASDPSRCRVIVDRAEAIRTAVRELCAGDVLLLAGKGACHSQLIHGVRVPFCEAQIVREALCI